MNGSASRRFDSSPVRSRARGGLFGNRTSGLGDAQHSRELVCTTLALLYGLLQSQDIRSGFTEFFFRIHRENRTMNLELPVLQNNTAEN